jgi:PmbA protein
VSQKLLEIARRAAKQAQKKGAQNARVQIGRNRHSTVEWRDGKLERLRESTRMSLSIDLFVAGRYSSNTTSDLRLGAIERFLDETIAATRYLSKDPHRKLPDPQRYKNRFSGDLELYDGVGLAASSTAKRKRTAQAIEAAMRTAETKKHLVSASTGCSENQAKSVMVCTNGMEGVRRGTVFVISGAASVKDRGARKPRGWWWAVSRTAAGLPAPESVGRQAVKRALSLRGAGQIKSGRYPCIIENAFARRLLSHLLRPLRGHYLQQKRSFFIDKLDHSIGSPHLHIVDNPHLKGALGSRTYDGEGMSTVRRPIFKDGVLKSYFLDTYYASKLGKTPTTAGTSNLMFKKGTRDLDGLMQAMGEGILITGFSGGNSNTATGDFSIGVRGLWVENGRAVKAISEMNLAGNHLTFWKKLAELGNDPFPYSSVRVPSLRFTPVQFSGA